MIPVLNEALFNREKVLATYADGFEDLVNAMPALVARMDCNLQVLYSNNKFTSWFPGNNTASRFFHLAVGDRVFDQVQPHLGHVLTGQAVRFTISFEKDSETCYMDVSLSPQLDNRRRVSSIIFHGTDVTENVKEQRTLRDYFENATIGLHWVNANGTIVYVNSAELKMLGYEEHEYKGQHISRFHKSHDCITDILTRLSNGEVLRNYEAEMLCKDGGSKFVTINSSVFREGNKFIHTRCFTIDITAQKLAAEAARESEQRFKIIADLVPLVLWTSDENGIFTFLNRRWQELTGKEPAEHIGNKWLNAVHPDDQANIRASWEASLIRRDVFEAKFRILNDSGGHTACYVNAVPRFDNGNNFIGYVGIIQDFSMQEQITASLERMVLARTNDLRIKNGELSKAEHALKTKNEELEKINSELSAFAHVASHDLQEPLRKIQTFIDRVIEAEKDTLSEKSLEFMNKIEGASGRMRDLIRSILLYSRTNNSATEREYVNLNDLLGEVISEFEVKIEETNAIIESSRDLPIVRVTRIQFHQLFLNLISNALKFSTPGIQPHITISSSVVQADKVPGLEGADEYYNITVADNGIGFETEYAERIFEMFNRLHSRKEYEGTGIGLAICKKIVERHGGKLLAVGEIGQGARFNIYIPLKSNG